MSKLLVIPDVHLKAWMFRQAAEIMETTDCDGVVCIGDLVDDWGCKTKIDLYEETMNAAIEFAEQFPDSLWCYGNHDLAYLWNQYDHPGYSQHAESLVINKLEEIKDKLSSPENYAIIHRVDNTLFSHAGLAQNFVMTQLPEYMDDLDCMLDIINGYGVEELWEINTPIWVRPQGYSVFGEMFPSDFFQVVGHTPVSEVVKQNNLITTDTFSTYPNGMPVGNQEFCWVNTVEKTWGYFQ